MPTMRGPQTWDRRRSLSRSPPKQRMRAVSLCCLICCLCACLNSFAYFHKGASKKQALKSRKQSTGEEPIEYDRGTTCRDLDVACGDIRDRTDCLAIPGRLSRCARSCGLCTGHSLEAVPKERLVTAGRRGDVSMPMLGFGTAGMSSHTDQAVAWALESGYRLLDSAQAREWYREDLVFLALSRSSVPRGDVFLTSKLHPRHHGLRSASRHLNESLEVLNTTYLDLLLLHYPRCWDSLCGGSRPEGTWHDSWRALEQAMDDGRLRAIGVSNFDVSELEELRRFARLQPAVVQVNIDVFAQNREVQWWCRQTHTQCQAYSSQGSQWTMRGYSPNPVLQSAVVGNISAQLGRTPSQVVLRWGLQSGHAVIPQSSNRDHIASNVKLFDFVLSRETMQELDSLDGTLAAKS